MRVLPLLAIAALLSFSSALRAQDGAALLAKSRAAFLENRERERYWTWTTTTERSIVNKGGTVAQAFPSVTVESPIRPDGKRCNAVLAWGDGVEPYLANAPVEERCAVERESPNPFQLVVLLQSHSVHIRSRSADEIVIAIDPDKAAEKSADAAIRCAASLKASVHLDPTTSFPRRIEIEAVTDGCFQRNLTASDHYEDVRLQHVNSGISKNSTMEFEYALQKDRSGDSSKDFWICVRRRTVRDVQKGDVAFLVYGRRLQASAGGANRRLIVSGVTTATELSAESTITFHTGKQI